MRLSFALVLLLPSVSFAQTEEMVRAAERKLADQRAAKWVLEQEAADGGFYLAPQGPKTDAKPQPSLRATNGAARALKYLGSPLLKGEREKHAAFVLKCYDPKTGGFAEPGGTPDVTITAIGVMAAAELGIAHEKYEKAMDYLKANAKTFEEVRIGAAAVEAWGVKDCPFDLKEWHAIADKQLGPDGTAGAAEGLPRDTASVVAMKLRLGAAEKKLVNSNKLDDYLQVGQWADGGYGRAGAKQSDIESTYRVMRAFMLMKERPKDRAGLRAFIESHRNNDGGYATKPGEPSSMSGVYYCAIVSKWLDDMEAKK